MVEGFGTGKDSWTESRHTKCPFLFDSLESTEFRVDRLFGLGRERILGLFFDFI